jgi:hypothetical protein
MHQIAAPYAGCVASDNVKLLAGVKDCSFHSRPFIEMMAMGLAAGAHVSISDHKLRGFESFSYDR